MLKVYKKLIGYAREKKHLLFLTIIFSLGAALLQITSFYYIYQFLIKVLIEEDLQGAKSYAVYITLFMMAGGIVYFLSLTVSHLFAFRLETNLRKYGIHGLMNSSFRFFDMNSSGRTRKILDDNAAQTHMAVAHLIPDNTGAMLTPILVIILGFIISLRVGLVLLFMSLVTSFIMKLMMGEQKFLKIYQESLEKLSSETIEYIRGMQVVKIFGVDVRSFKALNDAIKTYGRYALNYSLSCKTPYVIFQEIFLGIAAILIPVLIFFVDINQEPKAIAVELIMTFFLTGVMFTFLMKVMYISMYIFQAKDAVEKLESLYEDMQKDQLDFGEKSKFENYDIEFENVTFRYKETPVLENLSFKLPQGKSYALVGASGSGKSTIAKLISGFYNIDNGAVKIGGEPLTSYTKEALIKNIAFVFQDSKLFKTTIFNNVAMARKGATKDEVMEAMKEAGCNGMIEKFADRENTVIGSKGVYLSGGEKQRISIARAILKKSKIVIFDEASAAIDPDNEHEIQKAFSNLMKDKTVIMIAHRLTTIKDVDEILVLEKGRIIERGSHSKLMAIAKAYKHFQDFYAESNDWRVVNEAVN